MRAKRMLSRVIGEFLFNAETENRRKEVQTQDNHEREDISAADTWCFLSPRTIIGLTFISGAGAVFAVKLAEFWWNSISCSNEQELHYQIKKTP